MTKIINPNTPSFIPEANRIGINDYIGENPDNIEMIEQTILSHKATLIDAPTNSGKSTVMGELFRKWVNKENRRCYYLLPKVIQQHQFEKTYLKGVPVINMNATDAEKEEAKLFGANITWQGFLQNSYDKELMQDDIVIVDEAHLLINNQSFINDTKHLVRKLQRGKFKVVLLSGTPNFTALTDLFKCTILSFYFKLPPIKRLQPVIIDGKLVDNVTEYLRNQKWDEDGLNVIRVNDKDKHQEIKQWAIESLRLNENQIQIINKDIADPRYPDPDYQYLIDSEAIHPAKKLLITTIFADEGININNTNIKTIGVFYDPKLRTSSQRCRDSVIQFCARFRNLHRIENYAEFRIKLFLPSFSNSTETQNYYHIFDVQQRTANRLIAQLAETRKDYNNRLVMQSFPFLLSGTDPQANLVIEAGDSFFEVNRQGLYFNTKSQIDRFKSNQEFLSELSAYFEIGDTTEFSFEPNLGDRHSLRAANVSRMLAKVETFRPLKEKPADVLWTIGKVSRREELMELCFGLNPSMDSLTQGAGKYDPLLIKAIEEDAQWLLFLKSIGYPIGEFAGLLLHKREFHEKMRFMRFLLSRAAGTKGSMNNLFYVANFAPFATIIEDISAEYLGKGFQPKKAVIRWVSQKMPYYLKTKRIDANQVISELFEANEQRQLEDGKKVTYISINRKRDVNDLVRDFLYFNEHYYPTVDGITEKADDYTQKQIAHNVQQGAYRNDQIDLAPEAESVTLGKARVEMEKSKKMLQAELFNNFGFKEKVNSIAGEMIERFKTGIKELGGISKKLDDVLSSDTLQTNNKIEQMPDAA